MNKQKSRKRFLIVVGLPKSGTTFIYSQFKNEPDHFNLPAHRKEIDYFRGRDDFDQYMTEFSTHDDDKVFLDASPLYINDVVKTSQKIRTALEGHDVRILVCMREPLERAYSHYLHDVAQHQKITGHADYSFLSPPVLAKYLFPLTDRIRHLQEVFGAENVFGFSFKSDNSHFRDAIVKFANLPDDWQFDFNHNPSPGFTSPQAFYDPEKDSTIVLGGKYYLLPKGRLLVVNRQYSLYRSDINRRLANSIMRHQASITNSFDTGLLSEEIRTTVSDDYSRSASLLGIDLPTNNAPHVFQAQVSDDLPEGILKWLECVGNVNDVFAEFYKYPLRQTELAMVNAEIATPSLAQEMARHTLSILDPEAVGNVRNVDVLEGMIKEFGPIPVFLEALCKSLVNRKKYDEIAALLEPYGDADSLLWPVRVNAHIEARGLELPEDVLAQLSDLKLI